MKNEKDGGEAIVEALRRLSIDYIICCPGSEWAPVWEALHQQKVNERTGPKYLQCWHEMLALNIATGYTLITGKGQAVLLHAGSGVLQGALGLNSATRGEVPMIVMSGESVTLGKDPKLTMEMQWYAGVSVGGADRLVAPLVKHTIRVQSPHTLHGSVLRAGQIASRIPKGPVYLDVPLEWMLHGWTPESVSALPATPKTRAMPEDIGRLANAILKSKNPIIVADNIGVDRGSYRGLSELAEALAIPVIGGGSANYANFAQNNSLWIGVESYEYLEKADLIILIGGRTPWNPPSRPPSAAPIIVIHDHPLKSWLVYQELHASEYIEGDIGENLNSLTRAVRDIGFPQVDIDLRRKKWATVHEFQIQKLQAACDVARSNNALNIYSMCSQVAELLPLNSIFVDETVTHSKALRQCLPLNDFQAYFRNPGGGLGQGLGIALGIKLAAAERPVILFVGDGSFLFNPIIQGLGAARDFSLPIIIVVLNNEGYASMGNSKRHFYPDSAGVRAGSEFGVKVLNPQFERLGESLGFTGACVETYSEFNEALSKGCIEIEAGRTFIINAMLSALPSPSPYRNNN